MMRRHVQHEGEGMYDDMRGDRDIMVPMRDGIKLACDVYRPVAAGQAVPGAFPVILERTPYGKGQTSRSEISRHHPERPTSRQEVAAFFVHHGYVVVYQDCRGRYGSEGAFEKYLADEWGTVARHARRGGTATDVSPRSDPSGAYHRRPDLLGRTHHGRWGF